MKSIKKSDEGLFDVHLLRAVREVVREEIRAFKPAAEKEAEIKDDDFYTMEQTMKILHLKTRAAVYRRNFTYYKSDNKGKRLFDKSEVLNSIKQKNNLQNKLRRC